MSQPKSTTATAAMAPPNSQTIVESLSSPNAYPERTRDVRMIETHISWVFLTDRHAYKLKKPVKFDFLDFSTPELRRQVCQRELELNRRLAPDVYLGVAPVAATPSGRLKIDGDGNPVDWVVRMRRLPEACSLDRLIADKKLSDPQIQQIANTLVKFYRQVPPVSMRTDRYRRQIEEHCRANRDELLRPAHGLDPDMVKRVHAAQLRVLRLCPDAFDNRVRDGRIVEGHGDLRPEHIYLNPSPTIIDCIEFNSEFRQLDVLDELSFLAIECAILGANEVGGRILDQYCQSSADQPPRELLSFYMSYRASVRAKVNALRAQQLTGGELNSSLKLAARYLSLADHYAREIGPPFLIVVRGLSGTGKSTVASAIAESLGTDLLQTDVIRGDCFPETEQSAAYGEGNYQPENRRQVYEELFQEAGKRLANGVSVVLDGVFLSSKLRAKAALLARQYGAAPALIECQCPGEIAEERIASRQGSESPSQARPEFVQRQREQEEPDPPGLKSCPVDTTASLPEMRERVFEHLKGLAFQG